MFQKYTEIHTTHILDHGNGKTWSQIDLGILAKIYPLTYIIFKIYFGLFLYILKHYAHRMQAKILSCVHCEGNKIYINKLSIIHKWWKKCIANTGRVMDMIHIVSFLRYQFNGHHQSCLGPMKTSWKALPRIYWPPFFTFRDVAEYLYGTLQSCFPVRLTPLLHQNQ